MNVFKYKRMSDKPNKCAMSHVPLVSPFLNKKIDSFTNLKENMIAQQEGCSKMMSILCKAVSRKAKVCENS